MLDNLNNVKSNIEKALLRSGRDKEQVEIIAVTKTVDTQIIEEIIELGIDKIGENRVQELQRKMTEITSDVSYHMIGHLQTNKVKYIYDKVSLIHSLDRISLAKELDKRGKRAGATIDTLIQVNISEEESKFGLSSNQVLPFIEEILSFESINIKGLMTIAPHTDNTRELREIFRAMRKLKEDISRRNYEKVSMDYLSMGMSNDYEIAIEEGSNMIRIGTGLFGKRNY